MLSRALVFSAGVIFATLAVAAAASGGVSERPLYNRQQQALSKSGYEAPVAGAYRPPGAYGGGPAGVPYGDYHLGGGVGASPGLFDLHSSAHGLEVGKLFGGVALPTASELLHKLVFVGGAAGVATLVLLIISTMGRVVGWKVPVLADIKDKVMQHVNKVDARRLEQGWNLLSQAMQRYNEM